MQEEIFFKGENIKTKVKYFTTYSGQTSDNNSIYYVITDSNNQALKLVESETETKFGLDPNNYNIPLSAISAGYNIYSGTVVESELITILSESDKASISEQYIATILFQASPENTSQNAANPFSFVFFEELKYNDYFMNVKINRSVDVLNTLNIYNVPVNNSTKFNNNKGVLYGKIEALQVILDDSGERIKIPIKNAAVGIFNPSDEFPSIGSTDVEGNRIRLNLYENILSTQNNQTVLKSYGSFQSYLTDLNFSPTDILNYKIPDKYKYTSATNEEGEFILFNVPSGSQTLMLEVDLLKQGLEPEEVALNFFPYPTNDEPNVSNIPHLYFNQFPINIVPSWGEFDTGYTEVNITITLDLRKWITYFTYPISAKAGNVNNISNQNTNNDPKVLEELFAEGTVNPFTVFVRDMTKPFVVNAPPKVEMVKIIDIYDKNLDFKCGWNEEFKIRNNKIEFTSTNFNAFKLPANLYDPNGTDSNGNKGVWLGAYQIKTSYPGVETSFQATGYAEEWPTDSAGTSKYFKANHYDLNRYNKWNEEEESPVPGSGIGRFPYEKPWSLTYPENYKITRKPSVLNPLKSWDNSNNPNLVVNVQNTNGATNTFNLTSGEFFLQPRYLDGDMAGGPDAWATNANGYGLQVYDGTYYGNNFSREVTKNEIWRYEAVDHWTEEWSNGYNAGLTPQNFDKYPNTQNGKPDIVGERYQRLEAGYAYWLKPRGWPRIQNEKWGDHLLENDFLQDRNHDYNSVYQSPNSYNSYYFSIYNYLNEITLQQGSRANFFSKFGRLNIYRIEKPYYTNPKKPPFTSKFAKFYFGKVILDQSKAGDGKHPDKWKCKAGKECNSGGLGDKADCFIHLTYGPYKPEPSKNGVQNCEVKFVGMNYNGNTNISILNIGTTKVYINGKESRTSGKWEDRIEFTINENAEILLPANDKYNPGTNAYEGASYLIYFGSRSIPRGFTATSGCVQPIYKYAVGTEDAPNDYYLNSLVPRQVGVGPGRCDAVRDFNNAAGISVVEIVEAVVAVVIADILIGINIFGFPIGYAIPFIFPGFMERVWKEISDVFIGRSGDYTSQYRENNNIGLFINGTGYYVPAGNGCFSNGLRFLDKRGPLPYLGEEVKDAANLDIKTSVPLQGSWWYTDYRNGVGRGAPLMIFQPKKMYENNLKGTDGLGYYMEYIKDGIILDYAKAFQ